MYRLYLLCMLVCVQLVPFYDADTAVPPLHSSVR
jgi:hypothetical protein